MRLPRGNILLTTRPRLRQMETDSGSKTSFRPQRAAHPYHPLLNDMSVLEV